MGISNIHKTLQKLLDVEFSRDHALFTRVYNKAMFGNVTTPELLQSPKEIINPNDVPSTDMKKVMNLFFARIAPFKSYVGQSIAIDMANLVYRFVSVAAPAVYLTLCSKYSAAVNIIENPAMLAEFNTIVEGSVSVSIERHVHNLVSNGLRVIFVDENTPSMLKLALGKRDKAMADMKVSYMSHCEQKYDPFSSRLPVNVKTFVARQAINRSMLMGIMDRLTNKYKDMRFTKTARTPRFVEIPGYEAFTREFQERPFCVFRSPNEGEAGVAVLYKHGYAQLAYSRDTDLLAYGVGQCVTEINHRNFIMTDYASIISILGLTRSQVLAMCILHETDYNVHVNQFGPSRICSLVLRPDFAYEVIAPTLKAHLKGNEIETLMSLIRLRFVECWRVFTAYYADSSEPPPRFDCQTIGATPVVHGSRAHCFERGIELGGRTFYATVNAFDKAPGGMLEISFDDPSRPLVIQEFSPSETTFDIKAIMRTIKMHLDSEGAKYFDSEDIQNTFAKRMVEELVDGATGERVPVLSAAAVSVNGDGVNPISYQSIEPEFPIEESVHMGEAGRFDIEP